ncbi:MAG: hypothetical protein HC817_13820 [Saprospiraceae bacterium]|nr:hypothetical protein [Saprospiraceae bacterium]
MDKASGQILRGCVFLYKIKEVKKTEKATATDNGLSSINNRRMDKLGLQFCLNFVEK